MKSLLSLAPAVRKGAVTLAISAVAGTSLVQSAQAAPKLQIWPGQRVLMLLPIAAADDWKGDAQLGTAVPRLVQPELQKALEKTRKFSITLPYRFDPVLQRSITEKRIPEADVRTLLATPTLDNARPLMDKLHFDQPAMIADVELLDLTVGGSAKAPSLQLQFSGRLYEQGNGAPIKSIVVRSASVSGSTPEQRILRAADLAFAEIAAQFVAPPPSFALPSMVLPTPPASTPAPAVAPTPVAPAPEANIGTPPAMTLPSTPPVTPPNSLSSDSQAPSVPKLPPARPPLGLSIQGDTASIR